MENLVFAICHLMLAVINDYNIMGRVMEGFDRPINKREVEWILAYCEWQ